MSDFLHRIADVFFGSEFLPAFARTPLMRLYGYNFDKTACIWARSSFRSKKVRIGSETFVNIGFYHDGYDELTIGNNVKIGPFVRVITASHNIGPSYQRGEIGVVGAPVVVKSGAWIGAGVTLLPGVTVEKGCVIGAGSMVVSSTHPDSVYVGVPARKIRTL